MSDTFDLVVAAHRVLLPEGEQACSIAVSAGRIVTIESRKSDLPARRTVVVEDDLVVLPGLVDSHVHVCEPGNTAWEGFETATAAAAAGGITTIVDMPIDSVPATVDLPALDLKREVARSQCHVDVGFWGGVIPGNLERLGCLVDAGVLGFKCFLGDSGSDDLPPLTPEEMERALSALRYSGLPLLVHAESAEVLAGLTGVSGTQYRDYLRSRPRGLENLAVAQVIEAARRSGGHAHVCHLSSSDAVAMIRSARREGVKVTAETCPHYLALCAEDIPDGSTSAKCSPPIRERDNQGLLWDALASGIIAAVVSDHSPATEAMRHAGGDDFGTAWSGISSLQVSLPVTWNAARSRGLSLSDIVNWMATGPAALAGLASKGAIEPGRDADLCLFAPEEQFVVEPTRLLHRNPGTPYDGQTLFGVVHQTWLRGEPIERGRPRGRILVPRSPE